MEIKCSNCGYPFDTPHPNITVCVGCNMAEMHLTWPKEEEEREEDE